MNHDIFVEITVAALTLLLVPWTVWVTRSIFAQNLQIALLKQEIKLLDRLAKIFERAEA